MIKLISSEQTYPLRLEVLWSHLSQEKQCRLNIDDLSTTFHVGATQDEQVVCIGTFLKQSHRDFSREYQYRLRAMATHPNYRGQGWGKKLMVFAIEELKHRKQQLLWCDAREVALDFYAKLGFQTIGEAYIVPHIGVHKLMYYNIS